MHTRAIFILEQKEGETGKQRERQRKRVCEIYAPGNTKGGSITVPLTSCLTHLDLSVLQIKTKFVSCHAADS